MLRVRLHGQLTADLDGTPLDLPTSERARALIAWLALNRGPQSRSVAAEQLWPGAPAESARANLRTAVWAVRRAWGPAGEALRTSRATIELAGDVSVDPSADERDDELLPGLDDEWAQRAREDEHAACVRRLAARAEAADAAGDAVEALRCSRRLADLEPLDEGAHRAYVRRLVKAGERATAVVVVREFADRLQRELGVRPSPATRAVHAQARTATSVRDRPRVFGRTAELTSLLQDWAEAADGRGRVVLLTGEGGIGKTTLLTEVAQRAREAGGRTALSAGVDVAGEVPFAAWLDLARGLTNALPAVPEQAGWPVELARLSPELARRLHHDDVPPPVVSPELERLRLFEAALRLVEWSCRDRPVLLALDDAHRADRVSLRLVAHVGRRLAQLPALLVLTRREGAPNPELDGLLADLLGAGVPLRELTLGPVGDTEIAALAQSQTPLREPDLRAVVAAAEGNPLLAVETARSLAAGGVGPPPNLRTAVRATVGRLPRDTVEVVQLLAVAGRPLQRTELHRLAAPGTADAAARSEGLLVGSTGRLGFRHELLRAAVYADLVDPAELHERVAGALDPEELVEVGHHLAEAGRPREAAQRFAAAAARAREVGAVAEAVDLLTRAVELDPDDGRLWLELEETWAWTGRPTDMDAAWARVVRLLPAEELPAAWCRRGRQFRTVVCHPEEALRCYRTAQESAPAELDPSVRAEILVGLAWGDAVAGSGEEFEDLLAAVDDLPSDLGPQARADVLEIRMQGMIRQGRFREAADLVRPTSPDIGSDVPDRAYGVLVNAACALVAAGDDEAALAMIERAVAATGEIDVMAMQCLTARAHVLARLGRYDEAEAAAQQVQERADRLDSPALSAVAAHDHGLVALAAGRYDDAARLLGRALDEGAGVSRVAAGLMRAEALARSGNAASAEAQLRAALTEPTGPADQPWTLVPRVAWVQALIAHARSDTDGVRRRLDEAERGWRAMGHRGVTGEDYLASIVDLGRPPVVGLVEPDRELARIEDLRSALEEEERCRAST